MCIYQSRTVHHLCLVGHYERQLGIHRSVPNEVAVFHGKLLYEVPLASGNKSPEEDAVGLWGSRVGVVSVVLKDVEFVLWIGEIHLALERQV